MRCPPSRSKSRESMGHGVKSREGSNNFNQKTMFDVKMDVPSCRQTLEAYQPPQMVKSVTEKTLPANANAKK